MELDPSVEALLQEMESERAIKQRPKCVVCDTFSPVAREFVDRAFEAGFTRAQIRDKLRMSLGIVTSPDSVWKHWSNHARG